MFLLRIVLIENALVDSHRRPFVFLCGSDGKNRKSENMFIVFRKKWDGISHKQTATGR